MRWQSFHTIAAAYRSVSGVVPLGAAPVRLSKRHQRRILKSHSWHVSLYSSTKSSTHRMSVRARANDNRGSNDNSGSGEQPSTSGAGIPAGLLLFVGAAAYTFTNLRDELADVLYDSESLSDLGLAGFGLGDAFGALLWAAALWYVSPLQLLLVFLGKIETDRPSDWIMNKLGRATQQPVDAVEYVVPTAIRAAAAAMCLAGGVAVAAVLGAGLGDPTWSISSGIGALFAAAIFEVGRPARLTPAEAQLLESQWQDFATFADARLQRSGRCHESEVFQAFRRRYGKYRSQDVIADSTLRDMVRNWHPGVERTRTGYLRNISLQQIGPTAQAGAATTAAVAAAVRSGSQANEEKEKSLLDSIVEAADANPDEKQA